MLQGGCLAHSKTVRTQWTRSPLNAAPTHYRHRNFSAPSHLFENSWKWLNEKFPPASAIVWLIGLFLPMVGIGISIWARLTLGANWSGVVTLKKDHELIRSGLYRWIRHPIYTGILLAVIGTALARGHLRGWLGFVVLWGNFFFKARREET